MKTILSFWNLPAFVVCTSFSVSFLFIFFLFHKNVVSVWSWILIFSLDICSHKRFSLIFYGVKKRLPFILVVYLLKPIHVFAQDFPTEEKRRRVAAKNAEKKFQIMSKERNCEDLSDISDLNSDDSEDNFDLSKEVSSKKMYKYCRKAGGERYIHFTIS